MDFSHSGGDTCPEPRAREAGEYPGGRASAPRRAGGQFEYSWSEFVDGFEEDDGARGEVRFGGATMRKGSWLLRCFCTCANYPFMFLHIGA